MKIKDTYPLNITELNNNILLITYIQDGKYITREYKYISKETKTIPLSYLDKKLIKKFFDNGIYKNYNKE